MTFKIIHLSPSNTGCLFTKCQWQDRAFRFLGNECLWQGIFNTALTAFLYMLLPYLGLQLPEVLQFIWAAVQMKRLLFSSHSTETFSSKDTEESACSFAGKQWTPGEFLMFLLAIPKKPSASVLKSRCSKNLNNSFE